MRIGIYDPYLDTMSGGEKYMLSAALCLAKDHDVSLFWDLEKKEEIFEKAKKRFDFDLGKLHFTTSIFSQNTSFVDRFMESRKFDRIIILSDGSLPFLGCPTIVHFQSPVEWVKVTVKTKVKLARMKKIICNSLFTKSYIDRKFGIHSAVIYPPIVLGKKKGLTKTNTILHVGRYGIQQSGSSYKKQEVLVQTFKKLVDEGLKDWELSLVMTIQEEDRDKVQTLQKSVEGYKVRFVINPENAILWEEYEKAKIYWHASGFGEDIEKHPDRAEHFGMSTVEAMGMGAVPIVINAGGQKEIVQDGENGYVWTTLEELAQKTVTLINDSQTFSEVAKNAVNSVEKYSLEKFCKGFSESI